MDDDAVVRRIPVHLQHAGTRLFLLQLPLQPRSSAPPSSADDGAAVSTMDHNFMASDGVQMHVKAETCCVRVQQPLATQSHVYDQDAGERFQDALRIDREQHLLKMTPADREAAAAEDAASAHKSRLLSRMCLEGRNVLDGEGQASATGPLYHAVFGKRGELYLRQIDACIPLRPSLAHLDAVDRCSKVTTSVDGRGGGEGATDTESGLSDMEDQAQKALAKQAANSSAALARKQSLQKKESVEIPTMLHQRHTLQRAIEDETWRPVQFFDCQTTDARELAESMYLLPADEQETVPLAVLTQPHEYLEQLGALCQHG